MTTTIEMVRFGRTLTDRLYGKQTAEAILREYGPPIALDFKGVISLGSSFGDEIVAALGPTQGWRIGVLNTNGAVRACLRKVGSDARVEIDFLDS
jgi:hypothetical protein